jgi:hypothetical protein
MRRFLALTGTLVFAAACSKGDTATAKTDSTATPPIAAAPAAATAAPNAVTVHMTDYAFAGPGQIPAGVTTFTAVNDGKTLHHVEIVRLDSGKTIADLEAELAKPAAPPTWAVPEGGPNAPDPGSTSNATLDLQPGNYAMVCFVDVPGGVPHFAKGMIKGFTVTAAPAGQSAVLPTPDVTVTLSDYAYNLSTPLTAGKHTIEVKNTAAQPHELELVRLAPGKTANDLIGWMGKMAGPPPGSAIGGVGMMVANTPNYFTTDLTPGNYAFICFVPDAKDGKPHFAHGMIKPFTVS